MRRIVVLVVGLLVAAPAVSLADEPAGEGGGAHHEDPSRHFNFVEGLDLSYKNKDTHGGPLGDGKLGDRPLSKDEAEPVMSPPFVLMVMNFLFLVLILGKFGGPFAKKLARTRSDQIKRALDEAAELRDEARQKLDGYNARLAEADAEIKKMIDGMRADAEADKQRVIAAAEVQAAAMKKDAEARIAAEIVLARAVLAREVAAAATAAAESILREKTTPKDQSTLVDAFIADLEKAAPTQKRSP
jgi:F-type H+-transporting ATPase subunit b